MQIPATQHAVQFVGKDAIVINPAKPVDPIGPTQMLVQIEACGICFSDTKLLHAFDDHPRKSEVHSGLSADDLATISSYHPGTEPTTPGHEPVGRVVQVGEQVSHYAVGDRVLVQADWKHIGTANSNAAFGYNFDGGLQAFVVIDERCVVTPDGTEFLIHVAEGPSAAAVGLIEPWATVEGSYAFAERPHVGAGRMLVVGADDPARREMIDSLIASHQPAEIIYAESGAGTEPGAGADQAKGTGQPEGPFSDIIYFGHDAREIEHLLTVLDVRGVLCVVLEGQQITGPVNIDVGRIHYDFIRVVGTTGADPAEGYAWIPANGEIRDGDTIAIVGAGGPMGTMHTIRNIVSDKDIHLTATDLSDERLAHLESLVTPRAERPVRYLNTTTAPLPDGFTYIACMVPVPAVVASLVEVAGPGAIINAFAGIAVGSPHPMNLQRIIENRIFMFGTSGSDVADMHTVLRKIEAGVIDTHISLDAISGIAGFEDAITAVMNRTSGGKIMVYPALPHMGYMRLQELGEKLPNVAALMRDGLWTNEAEDELIACQGLPREGSQQ